MTIAEKLNELNYYREVSYDAYTYWSFVSKNYRNSRLCSIAKAIEVKDDKPIRYYIKVITEMEIENIDMANEVMDFIKEELEKVKKDFESLKEKTPKEKLDNFVERVLAKDVIYPQELDIYKYLLKDLEVLNILKESLNYNFFEKGKLLLGLSEDKYEKIKEWLNENKTN